MQEYDKLSSIIERVIIVFIRSRRFIRSKIFVALTIILVFSFIILRILIPSPEENTPFFIIGPMDDYGSSEYDYSTLSNRRGYQILPDYYFGPRFGTYSCKCRGYLYHMRLRIIAKTIEDGRTIEFLVAYKKEDTTANLFIQKYLKYHIIPCYKTSIVLCDRGVKFLNLTTE